ncbi:MAG TPA: glycine cleavage system protein GcvH [Thermoanaerobaculia bacterium]|nr:glycine cleavage system protein GcvH [Thermoanaerobaculia bacterium]
MYPDDRVYSKEHEWVRREGSGDECVLGITLFAQEELGDVVFVELPEAGARFAAGAELGTIESVKAVAELYTPVACEVLAVNETVVDTPELLNEDPHDKGWLVRIRVDDPSSIDGLMSAADYERLLATG